MVPENLAVESPEEGRSLWQGKTMAASSQFVVSQFCSVSVNVLEMNKSGRRVVLPATNWDTMVAQAMVEATIWK